MTFGAPQMVLMLLVVPAAGVLLWYGARTRLVRLALWADAGTARRLARGMAPGRRRVRAALLLAGLTACAVALLRPQWGYHYEEVVRRGVDLVVVVDVSESMLAEDVSPSRLERAKREIADFLGIVEGDRVALVAAAGTSFIQCPLTLDYAAVRAFLPLVDTTLIPTPGTNLAAALLTAARALETSGPSRGRAVVLISDGGSLEGDPVAVATTLHEQGITVYTVGVGNPDSAVPIPLPEGGLKRFDDEVVTTRLEEAVLRDVARAGNGVYVRAVTGDLDLEEIYKDLRARHESAELGRTRRKVYHERFGWPLAIGLVCLVLEMGLPEGRRMRGGAAALMGALLVLPLPRAAHADVTSDVDRGLAAYESENYTDAGAAFRAAHDAAPDDPRTAFNLGTAELQSDAAPAAVELFESAAAQSPDAAFRARSLYNAGNAFARMRQFDKAAEAYERSLAVMPTDEDAKANLELVRLLIERHEQEQRQRQEQQDQQQQKDQEDEQPASQPQEQPAGPQDNENRQDGEQQPQDPADEGEQGEDEREAQQPDAQQQPGQHEPEQTPQHPAGRPEPQGAGEDEGQSSAAETAPGAMDRHEADRWLQQLPSEDAAALKDFWRRQQPRSPQRPRRDW